MRRVERLGTSRKSIHEPIGAEHSRDSLVVAIGGELDFGLLHRRARRVDSGRGLARGRGDVPHRGEEAGDDEWLDDRAQHRRTIQASPRRVLATAAVDARSRSVAHGHLVWLHHVPAACTAQQPGHQRGIVTA